MKNLTTELIAKATAAKSAEELFELAKENGVGITQEEANTYFAQLNANGAISDDELDVVTGGCGDENSLNAGDRVAMMSPCRFCRNVKAVVSTDEGDYHVLSGYRIYCEKCHAHVGYTYEKDKFKKI